MELAVDLSTGDVVLRRHQALQRFSVQARLVHPGDGPAEGALGALSAALRVTSTPIARSTSWRESSATTCLLFLAAHPNSQNE